MNWNDYAPEFLPSEFTCRCGCGANNMKKDFMDWLHAVRRQVDMPLVVSSGYRCSDHNEAVSSTGRTGPHTTGSAADIFISRKNAHKLMSVAFARGVQGIGVKQKGDNRFIHLDTITEGPRPTVWSY